MHFWLLQLFAFIPPGASYCALQYERWLVSVGTLNAHPVPAKTSTGRARHRTRGHWLVLEGKGKFQVKKGKVKKVKKGKKGKVKKGKGGLEAEGMEGSKGGVVLTSDMVGCGAHQRHGAKSANTEGVHSTIADANDGPITPRRKPPLTTRKRPAGADCGEVSGLEDQTPVKEPIAMKTPATFAGRVRPENPKSVVMWEGFRDIWNKEKTMLKKTMNQMTFWKRARKYYNEVKGLSEEEKL